MVDTKGAVVEPPIPRFERLRSEFGSGPLGPGGGEKSDAAVERPETGHETSKSEFSFEKP
jgi:hypothetical protein